MKKSTLRFAVGVLAIAMLLGSMVPAYALTVAEELVVFDAGIGGKH